MRSSVFLERPEIYNRVRLLSEQQRANPAEIIATFFSSHYTLAETRHYIYDTMISAIDNNAELILDPRARDLIFDFCEQLEILMEAVYLIHVENPDQSEKP